MNFSKVLFGFLILALSGLTGCNFWYEENIEKAYPYHFREYKNATIKNEGVINSIKIMKNYSSADATKSGYFGRIAKIYKSYNKGGAYASVNGAGKICEHTVILAIDKGIIIEQPCHTMFEPGMVVRVHTYGGGRKAYMVPTGKFYKPYRAGAKKAPIDWEAKKAKYSQLRQGFLLFERARRAGSL